MSVTSRPTTVVADIGGVLLRWDPRNFYRKIFADEAEMEWFLGEVCTSEWNVEQDRVFIDDSRANIEMARSVGMHTIHFVEVTDVGEALRGYGIAA